MTEPTADVPQPGDVGLTWITGWTGFWVSLGQWLAGDGGRWPWTRYGKRLEEGYPDHAFTVLPKGFILEAQPGGAKVNHISRYQGREVVYLRLPLTDEQRARVPSVAVRYEGVPYSFLSYLYLALWRVHIRSEWLRDKVRDSGHLICSQMADKIAEDLGLHLFDDGRLNQDVTPGDLFGLPYAKLWVA